MAEEEPDFSSLPLTERAIHKLWKVRKEAYEEAAKQFASSPDETDACFTAWMMDPGLWKKAVMDSNVAAQQEGITALCAFLQYGGPSACLRTRGHCVGPLVEKGLSSARAGTKAKATEALLLFVELDTPGPVMEELIPFLSHKMPKLIAATVTAITSIYSQFGARTVDPKPVLKVFPKVFGHADKNVRAEATKLAIELYKWLKDAMKPMFFAELKPVQQKELEEAFEKVKDEHPKQERLLRSQQAAAAAAEAAGDGGDEGAEEEPEELDAFDLAEPVDVLAKMPENFDENIASTKWKERKDALDALYAVINVPRLKDNQYDSIMRALAKCMKDANVAVVTVAANCIEMFGKGLRKSFAKYRSVVMSPMLERLKEKKQTVIDALAKGLDATFESTSLADCLEDIAEFSKNKNPNVKLETIRFLVRCLRSTRDFPSKSEQKQIAEIALKLLTESQAPIREAASEAMGTLMKIISERAMNPYMEGLDDIRKNKIKEYFESAQVKAKEKPKAAPPPPKPVASAGPAKKPLGRPGLKAPVKKPVASSGYGQAPVAAAPPAVVPPAAATPTSRLGPKAPGRLGLKKPMGASSGLASPGRPKATPPPQPVEEEEPPAPVTAPPKPRLGLGRGLAARPLAKESPQAAVPPIQPRDNGLSAVEKAELEELRNERDRWEKQAREYAAEKTKMSQEINDLQLQNAQLIEEHTRDNLAIRAKEAQIIRQKSENDALGDEVQKQRREIERLKRELQRSVRSTSPAPTDISEHVLNMNHNGAAGIGGMREMAGSRGSHRSPSHRESHHRESFASHGTSFSSEEKENNGLGIAGLDDRFGGSGVRGDRSSVFGRESAMSPPMRAETPSGRTSAMDRIGDWKRAQEVTSQLKLRIEQMKAKQAMPGRSSRQSEY